jgi:ribosomal protein S18 acetylase RimI-like enzyme
MTSLEFKEDRADAAQVAEHLRLCDSTFVPQLGSRVEIASYAEKIVAKARRFEAWQGGELVGLVAIYCNAPDGKSAFVTSVSVLPRAQGNGLGSLLVRRCIAAMRALGLRQVELEVGVDNHGAIALYRKQGFEVTSDREDTAIMTLEMDGMSHER